MDCFFFPLHHGYIIYIHLSVLNFRTFSKGMACKAVADRCRPSSSAATWVSWRPACQGQSASKTLGLFRNFKVNGWTYMKFWSFLFQWFFSFLPHLFCFAPRKIRKNPRGRERIVFQALSCSGAFLLGSTLPIPPIYSPLTRCLLLPNKNSVNSSEKQHRFFFGESMLVCCVFFLACNWFYKNHITRAHGTCWNCVYLNL